ncbi:MAG: DUF438 domain-containing protein [Prolixibacteraceae bacterium]|nr:DUF438 domain-containing protein [Prolixibacteraceae bacterium]
MSEYLNNQYNNDEKLFFFSKKLIETGSARDFFNEFEPLLKTVNARNTMQIIDRLLTENIPFYQVKANIGKLLNLFYKSLKEAPVKVPADGHFLYFLMLENRGVEQIIGQLKEELKKLKGDEYLEHLGVIKELLEQLKAYELHYIKKENILFPYIEKTIADYRCLQLMWSFHDDYRRLLKKLLLMLDNKKPELKELQKLIGDLFFVLLPIMFREEFILFPEALRSIPDEAWGDMLLHGNELGWCYIDAPIIVAELKNNTNATKTGMVDLVTGQLTPEQIILMMEHLQLDVTYVDENDEVRYFSGLKHRIFPRSKAIIGRKVQNCHPKESVHVVNEIVQAFRDGSKDKADFWIQMKGRFVKISYYALRDDSNNYKGTIEVSQDVSDIRTLEGEKRLLDWGD